MCYRKILSQSKNGCIAFCEECQHIHVLFGSIISCLSQEQFDILGSYIEETLPMYFPNENATQEVWIPFSQITMCAMTHLELGELKGLMQRAKKRLAYFKLLQNLSQN
jgi:hypothetical protein